MPPTTEKFKTEMRREEGVSEPPPPSPSPWTLPALMGAVLLTVLGLAVFVWLRHRRLP